MKKTLIFFLVTLFLTPFASAENLNQWYPSSDIHNIQLVELYTFNGLPKNNDSNREIKILVNHGYAIGYSEELKVPLYAVYRYGNLTNKAEDIQERYFNRPPKFQMDLRTTAKVHQNDYTSSGFDRGHMAPNYGLRTQYGHLSQIETFFMSNIVPQRPSLNRGKWAEAEKKIADELAQDDRNTNKQGDDTKDLWVISGSIFEGEIEYFSDKQIAIPSAFFKIIVRKKFYFDSSIDAIALYYPHQPEEGQEKEQFVTIDYLEDKTNLDFHPNLVDNLENKLEKTKRDWNWEKIQD